MNSPKDSFPLNEYAHTPVPACTSAPPATATAAAPATEGQPSGGHNDQDNYVSLGAGPSAHRRARTLKARIKRNMMLNDSFTSHQSSVTSSVTSATAPADAPTSPASPPLGGNGASNNNGGGQQRGDAREESIFEAASALASLGIMSPNSSMNAGGGSITQRRNAMAPLSDGSVTFSPGTFNQGTYSPRSSSRPGMPGGGGGYASAPAAAASTSTDVYALTSNIAPPPNLSVSQRIELSSLKERQQKEVDYLMAQQRRRHRDVLSMGVRSPPSLGGSLTCPPGSSLGGGGGGGGMKQPPILGSGLVVGSSGSSSMGGGNNLGTTAGNRMRSMSEHPQPSDLGSGSSRLRSLSIPSDVNAPTRLSNLVIPPSMQQSQQQPPQEVGISGPLTLIGSDIPLTFPQKLMEVLSNPEVAHIITWLPHGKGFIILQKRKFAIDVMPLYFKHSKFTSFTRKLNRWGFTRVSRGPEMGAYYHKYFQRGNYLLCMQMHCQSHNKPGSKKDASANKDKDAEKTGKEGGGVGAPPSSPAEGSETMMMQEEAQSHSHDKSLTVKNESPELSIGDGDSHMDHQMDHNDSSPVPQLPSVSQPSTSAPAPGAAPKNDEIFTFGTTAGNSAFSTCGMFSEPRQKTRHGGTLARLYNQHNHHPHRQHGYHQQQPRQSQQEHHQAHEGNTNSTSVYGQDFIRQQQQQIPQEGQGYHDPQGVSHGQQQDQKPWQQHRLVRDVAQDQHKSPQLQTFSTQQPSNASVQHPIPTTLRSCMKKPQLQPSQPQQQQPLSQQRVNGGSPMQVSAIEQSTQQSNLNQQQGPVPIDNMLGVNTFSSRNHPHIIANALDALKSCNEEAYLTALMNKEHDSKAKSLQPQGNSSASPPLNTYQVQSRVHAAMEAQLRQLEQYNRERQNSMAAENISLSSSSPQDNTTTAPQHSHALMVEKMKQLNKVNSQQQEGMGGNTSGLGAGLKGTMPLGTAKVHGLKCVIPQSTYGTVARLYNEINAMNQQQQQQGGEATGNQSSQHGQQGGQRKFFRAVRRASAA